ncbi:enoyl-CoA hydratase/isomerase family protein [Mycobacterium sp. TY815]|uniref:enoyl-CoA hydratase/isomerase family protein n=1 Tax=Mycobacterium sp. TY815 TaxID=3050581 RepID=UPI0027415D29|nr:enoyl-CoA hydratase/isomerase family protein [Mycobacterium sp. TY815]MDP7702249.1 enoyl-CoA hydratase/isomerase family protein [Mycobacterium sp. TY815]
MTDRIRPANGASPGIAARHSRPTPWDRPSTEAELREAAAWFEEHIDDVYRTLTAADGDNRGPARLGDLVRAAGDQLPDLLPDRATRRHDDALAPSERLQVERDQGRFLRALLRNPATAIPALVDMRTPLPESSAHADEFRESGELVLETVTLRRADGFAELTEVTLANTMTLNAETNQLMRDLEVAVDVVTLDPSSSVGVIRGAPMEYASYAGKRVFCAGINLKHLAAGKISYLDFFIGREAGLLSKLARGVRDPETGRDVAQPWICVVDSFAIGGGMQLTLVTDHVIAVDDAWMSLPAASEGIVPGVANLRLPGRVGVPLARELILRGRRLSGTEAMQASLVDAVVRAADVDATVASVAAALSAPAVMPNKLMLAHGIEPEDEFATYLADFAIVQADRMHAPDVRHTLSSRL